MEDDVEIVGGEFACNGSADAIAGAGDEGPGRGAMVVLGERGGTEMKVEKSEQLENGGKEDEKSKVIE